MPEPMSRRQPPFEPEGPDASAETDAARRASRPMMDDPLEELARILGEGGGYPARPETAETRRSGQPARPLPQQLSALEAELFDELRASVTPDTRVRGDFEREITPPIPQHPVDDRDIASLRIPPLPVDPEPPRSVEGTQAQWSDFYAYDDGVAAGSYDPAFAPAQAALPFPTSAALAEPPMATERAARVAPGYPHATFDEFGRDEIAAAALEAAPMVAAEPRIMPHSREEERAVQRLPHETSGSGMKIAVAAIAVMLVGGGALAAWKFTGGSSTGEPVTIHADGKPLKALPDPSKTPAADAGPSLAPDDPKSASRIVSKQEDPVDQVSGRTAEGKEVRLINPGAQRPSTDVPHTVKTVVVRPDGSIVSDGTTVRAAKSTAPQAQTPPPPPAPATTPVEPPLPAGKPTATPPTPPFPNDAPPAPVETAPPPKKPAAAAPNAPQVKTVAVTPVAPPKPAPAVPTAKPVATTPVAPTAAPAAPMSLGPVGPKLASTPPAATAPKPAPAAPVALAPPTSGGGDFLVQISASGSENEARNSFAAASRKYSALAGKSVDIQRADLGAKGVFYRARVPAGSREQASTLCSQIQSQGGQCMVVKR